MAPKLKAGDRVRWGSPQGEVKGKVVKKLTRTTRIKGHVAKASEDHPEYLVRSEKTGATAAHRPAELKKA